MLNEQFKRSIIYGMPYDLFWFADPKIYFVYADAYNEIQKEKDVLNWQLGSYIQLAIGHWLGEKCKFPTSPIFYANENNKVERPKSAKEMREYFRSQVKPIFNKKNK